MTLITPNTIARLIPRIIPRWARQQPAPPSPADWTLIGRVGATAQTLTKLTGSELSDRALDLRRSVSTDELDVTNDRVVQNGFALVNESVRRCLAWEYYDVQFAAALSLIRGEIAEMATGEGKTLVQALAAFVLSLRGGGVHVMTSNACLAERDFCQLAPVLEQLGLRVALLRSELSMSDKHRAYRADVTYGPGYEFGFDYLRDQISQRRVQHQLGDTLRQQFRGEDANSTSTLQRGHAVAIVDEADSVMIDEATTPLCLASDPTSANPSRVPYARAAKVAAKLQPSVEFIVNARERSVKLTKAGIDSSLVSDSAPAGEELERPWTVYLEQALIAKYVFCRDVDYVVEQDRVVLVDQSTGRIFEDRSLQHGQHQAIEAKEQVTITARRRTQAQISRQQFFLLYEILGGMTGTARDAAREFREIYGRRVRVIPTRRPCRREVLSPRFFGTIRAKIDAIAEEVQWRNQRRQPVLVGTRTIEESERLAKKLAEIGVRPNLLNGVQDAAEAEIISQAGQPSAITIATNIAGRGTDIGLGPGVEQMGGLHVIATEVHTSPRVDRQLIGRTARQGNRGSCQVFVSAEDELIQVFGAQVARTMRRLAPDGGELKHDLSRVISRLQLRVEKLSFEKRRQLLRQGAWIENVLSKLTGQV
jgi:preprotein translocase subunit SecA